MLPLFAMTLATVPATSHPTSTARFAVRVQVVQSCKLAFDQNRCSGAAGQPPVKVVREAGRTIYEF